MAYLFIDNNLGDLLNVKEARNNLGLGTLATLNSNDVNIGGGKIVTDSLRLKANLDSSNYFLRSSSDRGDVEWFEVPSIDWVEENQSNVLLSRFSNDLNFVRKVELSKVALSGDFNDIENIPQSLKDVYSNDVLHEFLYSGSNLGDILDKEAARKNLGVGTLAIQDASDVTLLNITVKDNLKLSYVGEGFLLVDSMCNVISRSNFDIATETTPGMVYTCNVMTDDPKYVPTSALFSNVINELEIKVDEFKLDYLDEIVNLVEGEQYLFKSNLLSEFSTDAEKSNVRHNLGLGTISTQDSNNISVGSVTLRDLKFSKEGIENKILTFDQNNESKFVGMEEFEATKDSPGAVYIVDDYKSNSTNAHLLQEKSNCTVLDINAMNNYFRSFDDELNRIRDSVPSDISELSGADVYLRRENNLSDLTNITEAKCNLGLSLVATSGKYKDLTDKPYQISTFSNDVGFLVGDNNLSDVPDKAKARENLGLGSMALQDIRDVRIQGGIVRFKKLEVKNEFLYQDTVSPEGKILVCADKNGLMEWRDLPKASYNSYGAVKISDHIKYKDQRTDVVPTCKVFSVIEDNITRRLDDAMRKYLLSADFSEKLVNLKVMEDDLVQGLRREVFNQNNEIVELKNRINALEIENSNLLNS